MTARSSKNGNAHIDMDTLITLTNLESALKDYAAKAQEIYKKNLALGDKNASYDLANSVSAYVETEGRAFEVRISLLEYWKYVEGGSQGTESSPAGAVYPAHFPPPWAIERWIEVKPVIPRPLPSGRIPAPKQLSWMIARSIEKRGVEPFPAMATTIEELNREYKDVFAVALSRDLDGYISKVLNLGVGRMSSRR